MRRKPGHLLPLEAAVCQAARNLDCFHGYEMAKRLQEGTDARLLIAHGTLYRALARLLESALIEELESRDPKNDDERRRYYRLTTRGIAVARAEMGRLEGQLAAARGRRLLKARS